MTTYLCGPINGCTDAECRDWRELCKTLLAGPTLDPMRKDYRGREDDCCREIVEGDKADITASDVLLVNYVKPSVGTSMEVLLAAQAGKPVVVVCARGTNISPWLRYHASILFHTFRDACEWINARG